MNDTSTSTATYSTAATGPSTAAGPFDPNAPCAGTAHDFDFLPGVWDIANRRLRARGIGCEEWEEFPALSTVESRLGGAANIDETVFPTKGFTGLTLRSFDHTTRRWSITWINSTSGVLDPPVYGGFDGARGQFFGVDVDRTPSGDVPVQVVFVWTRVDADHARWEQAFSTDGAAWERNWVMDLTRRAGSPDGGAGTASA